MPNGVDNPTAIADDFDFFSPRARKASCGCRRDRSRCIAPYKFIFEKFDHFRFGKAVEKCDAATKVKMLRQFADADSFFISGTK